METNGHPRLFGIIGFVLLIAAGAAAAFADQPSKAPQPAIANLGFYEECDKDAKTQEQKDKLAALKADHSIGVGEWQREALLVVGRLPSDQKRLTLDEAKNIASSGIPVSEIRARFDAIAGAPDFDGGSGISRTIYYLDDTRKDAIYIMNDRVMHVTMDASGKQLQEFIDGKPAPSPGVTKPVAT